MRQGGQSGIQGFGLLAQVPAVAAAVVGLLALTCVVPAVAGATQAPTSAAFAVAASNGFRLDVESEAGKIVVVASERHPPIATFTRGGRPRPADPSNGAASIYRGRAVASRPGRIEADLGGLGRIALSFHPTGTVRVTGLGRAAAACAGSSRVVRRLGVFTGLVEFRGEGGYTAVRATRVRGSVGTPLPPGCAAGAASVAGVAARARRARSPRHVVLTAVDHRTGTGFEAKTTAMGVAFLATLRERLAGGLVVLRRAYAGAPAGSFSFAGGLGSARVSPPAPFAGSARYVAAHSSRSGSWSGDLEVTFPGGTVPMTGPGFQTWLGARR